MKEDTVATIEEIKAALLFGIVTGNIKCRAEEYTGNLAHDIKAYDTIYTELHDSLTRYIPEDSSELDAILSSINKMCRLMVKVGVAFTDADLIFIKNDEPLTAKTTSDLSN